MEKQPGVIEAVSGFAGGHVKNPSYRKVTEGGTGHLEAIRVVYDPAKTSYAKLLDALKDVPEAERGAQFVCVLALVRHADDPLPIICEGLWHGRILHAASGEHGFGYDPLFWVPERNCSSAELSPAEKNQLSHRARAMDLLRQRLGLK